MEKTSFGCHGTLLAYPATRICSGALRPSAIISAVDGIAFQANILALNAAVEAERAGDQCRGFSVVASEARSLAGRSALAAKEIKALIGVSLERVEQGTVLVDQAVSALRELVESRRNVSGIMGEISAPSHCKEYGRNDDPVSSVTACEIRNPERGQRSLSPDLRRCTQRVRSPTGGLIDLSVWIPTLPITSRLLLLRNGLFKHGPIGQSTVAFKHFK